MYNAPTEFRATLWAVVFGLAVITATPVIACSFDTDCSPGSKCVKGTGIYGICAGGLFPGSSHDRQPVFDPLDPNRTVGNTCSFDTDCGSGNRCSKGTSIYGTCVRGW